MKRLRHVHFTALMASLLATAASVSAETVISTSSNDGIAPIGASNAILYAGRYVNRDKAPYVRRTDSTQQSDKEPMEKSEFARFEEKSGPDAENRQPAYRYVPGRKPPYKRAE